MNNISILIPAYKPDKNMIPFLEELSQQGFERIILINDGSGAEFDTIFQQAQTIPSIDFYAHAINMGKGRTLKTGINHYLATADESSFGLITADADGQHLVKDIVRIAEKLLEGEYNFILGSRQLNPNVPLRSRFGNTITRYVYRLISGVKLYDTQTGLRGLTKETLPDILMLEGERYEYEMAMLMEINNLNLKPFEVPIQTVYINDNEGSHFDSITDSWKIYKLIFGYVGSSIFSAIVDIVMYSYFLFFVFPENLFVSVILARAISSFLNFNMNRRLMLNNRRSKTSFRTHLFKYYALVIFIALASYALTYTGINILHINKVVAKIISDTLLFIVSFLVQKRFVFN